MCGDLIDVGACLDIFHKVSSKSKTWQSNLTIYSKLAWTILSCDSAVAVCLWHKSFLLKAGCIFSKKVPCYSEYSFECQRYPWGLSRSAWAFTILLRRPVYPIQPVLQSASCQGWGLSGIFEVFVFSCNLSVNPYPQSSSLGTAEDRPRKQTKFVHVVSREELSFKAICW